MLLHQRLNNLSILPAPVAIIRLEVEDIIESPIAAVEV
jgi:hypothetical protein